MRSRWGLAGAIGAADIIILVLAVLAWNSVPAGSGNASPSPGAGAAVAPSRQAASSPPRAQPVRATKESAKAVHANELGLVPVLMYHRILAKRLADLDRTPSQLYDELSRLAKAGYMPITATEFVSGKIDLPAGAHPVVLTFDDGWPSHFALDSHGQPKPDTAVGVIYRVARENPGFRPVATFWVNHNPFGLTDRGAQSEAVRWLTERGFEVGNHTYLHPDLRRLSNKKVQESIVRQARLLKAVGATGSTTFALPYGSRPRKLSLAHDGSWDGTKYHYDAVFLAGAEPSESPFAKGFDKYAIPRVQANGRKGECARWCSTYWLDWLEAHPDKRYTSDGDPDRVAIPKALKGKIVKKQRARMLAY